MNQLRNEVGALPHQERLLHLVRQLLGSSKTKTLPVEAPLSELGLNSLKMVNLMLAIEGEFNIEIPQAEITPENFHSIASIEALVVRVSGAAAR
jgi:acyl carrier protein